MNFDDLLAALNRVGPTDKYLKTNLDVASKEFTEHNTLETFLGDWSQAQGWIARQSGVDVFRDGQTQIGAKNGWILSGELARENQSLQIRRLMDKWVVTTLSEDEGEACLFDIVLQTTVRDGIATYRRYWHLPNDGAAHVFAWRFTGFDEVTR